jgi:RHS repeat-associated protein
VVFIVGKKVKMTGEGSKSMPFLIILTTSCFYLANHQMVPSTQPKGGWAPLPAPFSQRKASVTLGTGKTALNTTHTYTYVPDSAGLLAGRTVDYDTTTVLTTTHSWDYLNRQTETATSGASAMRSFAYTYNAINQRTRKTLADGSYWDYSYDALGQVTGAVKKTAANDPIPGMAYGYDYDDIGNRKAATQNGEDDDYTVNLLNQYTAIDFSGYVHITGQALPTAVVTVNNQSTQREDTYFYRKTSVSNLWSPIEVEGTVAGAGHNGSDAVAESSGWLYTPSGVVSRTHDDDGNLINDGRWEYSWDGENRLIQMETTAAAYSNGVPRQRLTFVYDSGSRRVAKTLEQHDGTDWVMVREVRYLYNGWDLLAEVSMGSLSLERAFVWGLDIAGSRTATGGVGGLLAVHNTEGPLYPYYDANGNVMGLLDTTGTLAAEYEYSPFGQVIRTTGPAANAQPYRFSTKYQDTWTGLLYYGFRYYDPETGRWLNRDPIEEEGGLNLYGFVGNDPVNEVDLLGLAIIWGERDVSDESASCCLESKPYWAALGYPSPADCVAQCSATYWAGGVRAYGTGVVIGGGTFLRGGPGRRAIGRGFAYFSWWYLFYAGTVNVATCPILCQVRECTKVGGPDAYYYDPPIWRPWEACGTRYSHPEVNHIE